jgi:hypothetical protein
VGVVAVVDRLLWVRVRLRIVHLVRTRGGTLDSGTRRESIGVVS